MAERRSRLVVWHASNVSKPDRASILGHKSYTVWLTGLSGSGKSTLSVALEKALWDRGIHSYVLDGDNIRHGLNKDLGFSPEDRTENIRRIGEVARLLTDAGVITITAFISPYRADRELARGLMAKGDFIEVFVDCPLKVCEQRDPKGLYRKARTGQLPDFTGISAPYEPPLNAEITVSTATQTEADSLSVIVDYLERNGYVPPSR